MKRISRKTAIRPKTDRWHCSVCKTYGRVVEIIATGGYLGIALCKPCVRVAARAVLLPGGGQ